MNIERIKEVVGFLFSKNKFFFPKRFRKNNTKNLFDKKSPILYILNVSNTRVFNVSKNRFS